MDASSQPSKLNWSNALTILRIFLALAVPYLLLGFDSLEAHVLAGVLFVIASFTDYLDGILARRYGWITNFGKIVDSLADKLLVLGTFATLSLLDMFSFWWIVPILLREITITVLRMYFLTKGVVVQAVKSGKQKAAMQVATIFYIFLLFLYKTHFAASTDTTLYTVLLVIMYVMLVVTLYMTLQSGYVFFRNNWHLLGGKSRTE